jgi:hypothetical protein
MLMHKCRSRGQEGSDLAGDSFCRLMPHPPPPSFLAMLPATRHHLVPCWLMFAGGVSQPQ